MRILKKRWVRAGADDAGLSWSQDTRETVLGNGLRVVTQYCPGAFTSVLFNVGVGGYDEDADQLGIAHLTEHLVFKGTERRTVREVNEALARYGGELNAQTGVESTQYWCTVLSEYLEEGVDLLADLVFGHTVPPKEFDREKSVVIEELRMYDDQGDDRVFSLTNRTIYRAYPSMYNLGGTPASVSEITRDDVLDFTAKWYTPDNVTVVAVSGDPRVHDRVVRVTDRLCGHLPPVNATYPRLTVDAEDLLVSVVDEEMPGEQSHLLLTLPLIYPSPELRRSTTYTLLSTMTGGWQGSRIHRLREEYGYCYTVNMGYGANLADERFGIYSGLNAENLESAVNLIFDEFDEAAVNGFTEEEFKVAVNIARCSFLRQASSPDSACWFLADALTLGMPREVDAYLGAVNAASLEEVNEAASELLVPDRWTVAMVRQREA